MPNHPFKKMAEKVLGKKYNLGLTIIDATEIKLLNFRYRSKNKPTDILSFPINKNTGEIFLCLSEIKKEAPKFKRTFNNFVAFLFIHGLMHLKGFDHSSTMEKAESKFLKKFEA